ncbi:lysylphosphatidylglycerol synthase transmembrane domain-containing protein [Martelella soudanensis]|uniref:lysylphosphatidylglycerol synthase transmembrane domain-containing protein n=1 Tax=unclassified Martelella TaxID=2629616 RepID=UPI001FEE7376|nr:MULTISPECIES: lysylphosphatidylglycerol synthase transmembrane domain-containing protein [unclassified Martelella]
MHKFAVIPIAACLALLAGLIVVTGPERLAATFSDVPPVLVVMGLALVQVQIIASAWRWRFTAKRLGQGIGLGLAIREYYIGSALNLVLPGGMAGDALRAYRSRMEGTGGWKRPAAAVFLERLSGQLAFFGLCFIGLLAWPVFLSERLPGQADVLIWGASAVLLVCIAGAIAIRTAWLPQRLRGLGPDIAAVFWRDRAWLVQGGLSVFIVSGYIAVFLIASSAVGAPLPAIAAFTAIPLCLMTMLIPAGIGGWGTREAAAAALWPLFGYTSAEGVAASLLYGLLSLAGAAVPGGVSVAISLVRGRIAKS